MHQALPYKAWHSARTNFSRSQPLNLNNPTNSANPKVLKGRENVKSIVGENAVIVIGRCGCCMTHVVRLLLLGLGVNPAVYEVDEGDEPSVIAELKEMGPTNSGGGGCGMSFPTVFIGGRWFGGLERVMATHIAGELTPILRQAGALWL